MSTFILASAAWLALQALPLLAMPRLLIALALGGRPACDMEVYLCRALGIALLGLASAALADAMARSTSVSQAVASSLGTTPPSSSTSTASTLNSPPDSSQDTVLKSEDLPKSDNGPTVSATLPPLIPALLLYHLLALAHSYTNYLAPPSAVATPNAASASVGSSRLLVPRAMFLPATLINAALAAMGLWCILFGRDPERRSRRTGRDKHTSRWPFGESEHRRLRKLK